MLALWALSFNTPHTQMPPIRFYIIMATHHASAKVARALSALFGQKYGNFVCFVQDGASTDKTLEEVARIMGEMGEFENRLLVESAPDTGVYDAWNKAIARAFASPFPPTAHDWFLFLGADDLLLDAHVLSRSAKILESLPRDIEFAQGGLYFGALQEYEAKKFHTIQKIQKSMAEVFRSLIWAMPLCTPALFLRASLFADTGPFFDVSYRIAGDFAFIAPRLRPDNLYLLPFYVSFMEKGGLSSSLKNRPTLEAERLRVMQEILVPRGQDLVRYCVETYHKTGNPIPEE